MKKADLDTPMNNGFGQPSSGGNQAGDVEQFNPLVVLGAPKADTDKMGLQITVEMQGVGTNTQIHGWPGTEIPNRWGNKQTK
jgi:hypothetical protein